MHLQQSIIQPCSALLAQSVTGSPSKKRPAGSHSRSTQVAVQPLPQSTAAAAGDPQHNIKCRSHGLLCGVCFAADCQAGPITKHTPQIRHLMRQKQHPVSITTNQLLHLRVLASVCH